MRPPLPAYLPQAVRTSFALEATAGRVAARWRITWQVAVSGQQSASGVGEGRRFTKGEAEKEHVAALLGRRGRKGGDPREKKSRNDDPKGDFPLVMHRVASPQGGRDPKAAQRPYSQAGGRRQEAAR